MYKSALFQQAFLGLRLHILHIWYLWIAWKCPELYSELQCMGGYQIRFPATGP